MTFTTTILPRDLREAYSYFLSRLRWRTVLRGIAAAGLVCCLVLPFFALLAMGLQAGAQLGEVFRVYPRYLLREGWLVWLAALLCVWFAFSPALWSRFALAGRRIRRTTRTFVFSDWRILLYAPDADIPSGVLDYCDVVAFGRTAHDFVLLFKGDVFLAVPLEDLTAEQEDQLEALLHSHIAAPPSPDALPPVQLDHGETLWQGTVSLTPADFTDCCRILLFRQAGARWPLGAAAAALALVLSVCSLLLGPGLLAWVLLAASLALCLQAFRSRPGHRKPLPLSRCASFAAAQLRRSPTLPADLSGRVRITSAGLVSPRGRNPLLTEWRSVSVDIWSCGLLFTSGRVLLAYLPARCFADEAEMRRVGFDAKQKAAEAAHPAKA